MRETTWAAFQALCGRVWASLATSSLRRRRGASRASKLTSEAATVWMASLLVLRTTEVLTKPWRKSLERLTKSAV